MTIRSSRIPTLSMILVMLIGLVPAGANAESVRIQAVPKLLPIPPNPITLPCRGNGHFHPEPTRSGSLEVPIDLHFLRLPDGDGHGPRVIQVSHFLTRSRIRYPGIVSHAVEAPPSAAASGSPIIDWVCRRDATDTRNWTNARNTPRSHRIMDTLRTLPVYHWQSLLY